MIEFFYNLGNRLTIVVVNLGKFFLQPISISDGQLSPITNIGGVIFPFKLIGSSGLFGPLFDIAFRVIGIDPSNTTLLEMLPIIMASFAIPFIILRITEWLVKHILPS